MDKAYIQELITKIEKVKNQHASKFVDDPLHKDCFHRFANVLGDLQRQLRLWRVDDKADQHSNSTSKETVRAPVGLELETVARQPTQVEASSEKKAESLDEDLVLEVAEKAIREYSQANMNELEVAKMLNKLAQVLEWREYSRAAKAVKHRATSLAAKNLNQLDGFDF